MNIRRIRRAKDITQRELAEMVGVERSTVAKWESGKAIPRGLTLKKVAEALDCTIDELLKEVQ